MTIEMVLLTVVIVGLALTVSTFIKNSKGMQSFVAGPWPYLQGMIEAGVWAPPAQAKTFHPNVRGRQQSIRGDEGQ
jgi:hypothetical protein